MVGRNRRLLLVLTVLFLIAYLRSGPEPLPPPRRPTPPVDMPLRYETILIQPTAPVDVLGPEVHVELGRKRSSIGTAFSMAPQGVWLTARHVVDRCAGVALRGPGKRVHPVRRVVLHPHADLALLLTHAAAPGFTLGAGPPARGQNGYHIGYPAGRPGEVWSTLMGRMRMRVRGRYRTNEPVLVWAERRRWPAQLARLGGLSGGPTLDGEGKLVGVLVASSKRRGRVYSAAPASIRQLVSAAGFGQHSGDEPKIRPDTLNAIARRLRGSDRIALVLCRA